MVFETLKCLRAGFGFVGSSCSSLAVLPVLLAANSRLVELCGEETLQVVFES